MLCASVKLPWVNALHVHETRDRRVTRARQQRGNQCKTTGANRVSSLMSHATHRVSSLMSHVSQANSGVTSARQQRCDQGKATAGQRGQAKLLDSTRGRGNGPCDLLDTTCPFPLTPSHQHPARHPCRLSLPSLRPSLWQVQVPVASHRSGGLS